MFNTADKDTEFTERLLEKGYWPARAAAYVAQGKYSKAVEICKENIKQSSKLLSGYLIYGQALFYAGQLETAAEQFYSILTREPDNIVALKFIGDIKYTTGDEIGAATYFQRILEIDPDTDILYSKLENSNKETTRVITLKKSEEILSEETDFKPSNRIPFYTETIGDLYLAQGFPKLAYEVYLSLNKKNSNARITDKLQQAKVKILDKEKSHVKKAD